MFEWLLGLKPPPLLQLEPALGWGPAGNGLIAFLPNSVFFLLYYLLSLVSIGLEWAGEGR